MVGSLDIFLIVCHALQLLCVRSVEVMTSSQLFFSTLLLNFHLVYQCIPASMIVSPKGSIEYCFFYSSFIEFLCETITWLLGSMMTVMTLDVKLEWNSISNCWIHHINKYDFAKCYWIW